MFWGGWGLACSRRLRSSGWQKGHPRNTGHEAQKHHVRRLAHNLEAASRRPGHNSCQLICLSRSVHLSGSVHLHLQLSTMRDHRQQRNILRSTTTLCAFWAPASPLGGGLTPPLSGCPRKAQSFSQTGLRKPGKWAPKHRKL